MARLHVTPIPGTEASSDSLPVFTPDDIMAGRLPKGRVVVFDDDHYYMGGVLAELLAQKGCDVVLVTPSAFVSDRTANTLEQGAIHRRLAAVGVKIVLNTGVAAISNDGVITACSYTGAAGHIGADAVLMVASRISEDQLFRDLSARQADGCAEGPAVPF